MTPGVSICILCCNYGRFLSQAIEGCLAQNCLGFPVEIIVIDDGSTDETLAICGSYHDKLKVISEGNLGFGASLTRAVERTKGEFLFFLDADDYYLPGKIAAFLPWFQKGKLFVHDRCRFVNETGTPLSNSRQGGGSTSTIAVKREAARCLLPVENEISFHSLLRMGHGVVLEEAYTMYRVHGQNMTDRRVAGKWNTYLAGVTHNLASHLESLLSAGGCPWLEDRIAARRVVADFRSQAHYNEFEAALELRRPLQTWRAYLKMMAQACKGFGLMKRIYLVRTAQAFLMKPAFPKKARP